MNGEPSSEDQAFIIDLLRRHPHGLFGAELADLATDKIQGHALYTHLGTMHALGLLRVAKLPSMIHHGVPRRRYHLAHEN
jgi:hypothetical protein